ncbi:MAG: tRNA (adenosine(37)-N6)-threonylcarbamoyltransferase complex ATPase subunit type 1 TsaE [Nitrospirae bacterium]|nr:tRNA (adenosine(37)-N6)-threonylcarbamoyltransferase complex ATPase subunit type 1 TsaE [Nitrospirota bacterium]
MRLKSGSPADTEEIGQRLGRTLKAGDVVCLYGDLGAGKTTMVKGIASSFGIDKRDVTSASYTIIAEYPLDPPFYHIDLYRTESPEDLEHTGLWDILDGRSIAVIEWSERLSAYSACCSVKVILSEAEEGQREVLLEGVDEEAWNNL